MANRVMSAGNGAASGNAAPPGFLSTSTEADLSGRTRARLADLSCSAWQLWSLMCSVSELCECTSGSESSDTPNRRGWLVSMASELARQLAAAIDRVDIELARGAAQPPGQGAEPCDAIGGGAQQTGGAVTALEPNDERLPIGARVSLAVRAACDITDVAGVLASLDVDDLTPAALQMVQQRIHELACGVCAALQDPMEALWEIRSRLYPSEPGQEGAHA